MRLVEHALHRQPERRVAEVVVRDARSSSCSSGGKVGNCISRKRTSGRRSAGRAPRVCGHAALAGSSAIGRYRSSIPECCGRLLRSMLIRAKAPLRISFAGGGTDVPPFPEREGGLVLNATINRYAYGTLRPRDDDSIHDQVARLRAVRRSSASHEPLVFDGKLDLAKAAIRRFAGRESRGFDLLLHSNAPPGSGLGSSSAMMVALIGVLEEYRDAAADRLRARRAGARDRARGARHQGRPPGPVRGGVRRLQLHRAVRRPRGRQPAAGRAGRRCSSSSTTCCSATPARPAQSDHIIEDQTARYEQRRRGRASPGCARRRSSRSR